MDLSIKSIYKVSQQIYAGMPVLAALAACQAIHESRLVSNPSRLATEGKNLFGIKGKGTDGSILMWTWEEVHGQHVKVEAKFAKNKSYEDSFLQHRKLMERPRYIKVFNAKTFEEAAKEIYQAGYATDSTYPTRLIVIYKNIIKPLFKEDLS